jgi:hypothetical protein
MSRLKNEDELYTPSEVLPISDKPNDFARHGHNREACHSFCTLQDEVYTCRALIPSIFLPCSHRVTVKPLLAFPLGEGMAIHGRPMYLKLNLVSARTASTSLRKQARLRKGKRLAEGADMRKTAGSIQGLKVQRNASRTSGAHYRSFRLTTKSLHSNTGGKNAH